MNIESCIKLNDIDIRIGEGRRFIVIDIMLALGLVSMKNYSWVGAKKKIDNYVNIMHCEPLVIKEMVYTKIGKNNIGVEMYTVDEDKIVELLIVLRPDATSKNYKRKIELWKSAYAYFNL